MGEEAPKPRTLRVRHRTKYQYNQPIERSSHRLHLRPVSNSTQTLVSHTLTTTPPAPLVEYEDVFGNWATRFELTRPYRELEIAADSVVQLSPRDPFDFTPPSRREYPLAWMPWEREVLDPYLKPVELPEQQLRELHDYAMGFVKRNSTDLLETLFDMNLTIFREYQYVPGSTNVETTPFDVFVNRKGVCQDFANLFICMARLLNVPARYVYGYLHVPDLEQSRASSLATHAWIELYIPEIGWKAFDPTNGVLPHLDHVRVGIGRNYRDCTPTAGTLFGTAVENMTIEVEVSRLDEDEPPAKAESSCAAPNDAKAPEGKSLLSA